MIIKDGVERTTERAQRLGIKHAFECMELMDASMLSKPEVLRVYRAALDYTVLDALADRLSGNA